MGKRSRPINMLPICSDVGDQPKKGGGGVFRQNFLKIPDFKASDGRVRVET